MRNIKELLQIVRNNIEFLFGEFDDGICIVAFDLFISRQINRTEYDLLKRFIELTRPKSKYFKRNYEKKGYSWKPGKLQPRLDYLDKYVFKSLEELEKILKTEL